MKNIKKTIAFLLAVVMLLSAIQITAFADEIRYDDSGSNDKVSWSYTASTDTLYINGDEIQLMDYGALPTYKDGELVKNLRFSHLVFGKDVREIIDPGYAGYKQCYDINRYAYKDSRFDITFEKGSVLETIGDIAFSCSTVTSVTLPDDPGLSITICTEAFAESPYLKSFTMYDNVYELGEMAFIYDIALEEIRLSSKLSELDEYMFANCESLKEIDIPDGVVSIGVYCFQECYSLESINLPSSLAVISESAFESCTSLKSMVIPQGVKKLPNNVLSNCTSLESLDLGNITSMGSYTLKGCTALKSVTISDSLTSIPKFAFDGLSSLETVDLANVVTINGYAFQYCTSLKNIDLRNVVTINNYAFQSCTALESVVIPDTVTGLGVCAFYNCKNLSDVTLSKNISIIQSNCFSNCKLRDIELPEGVTKIGSYAFSNGLSGNITFPSTLESINEYAFLNCDLKSIDFGEEGKSLSIDKNAFMNNENLTSVTFTPRVISIGNEAFSGCSRIKTVNFETRENGSVIEGVNIIGSAAFNATDIETLVLPETLNDIYDSAFAYMAELKSIDMSKTKITKLPASPFYFDDKLTEIKLPEELTEIGNYAFATVPIKTLTIPASVKTLKDYAFSLSNLEEITIPNTVENIGEGLFEDTKSLKSVNIEEDITEIYPYMFNGCVNLEKVNIPNSVTEIGEGAFAGCSSLKIESVPDRITLIDDYAFYGASVDFELPFFLDYVGESAFEDSTIKKARLAKKGIEICANAFKNASELNEVVLSETLSQIPDYCFYGTAITEITIPDRVTRICDYSFSKTPLKSVNFSKNLVHINLNSFEGCTELKEVDLSGTKLTYINAYDFKNCTSLEKVVLPKDLTQISVDGFYGCTALADIVFPDKLKYIDGAAFYNCSSLKSIRLPESLSTIGKDAFFGCPLTSAEILNPDITLTELNDSKIGFTAAGKQTNLVITGYADSSAQQYAKNNGFKFYAIGYYDEFNTEVPNKGTVGAFANWYVDGTELHISAKAYGNGVIKSADFNAYLEDKDTTVTYTLSHIIEAKGITRLVVEDGITSLPDNLFTNSKYEKDFDNSSLTEVSLPDTLKTIGSYTFANSNIKSIVVPDSVSSIGAYAFYQADLSEGVQLGNGITEIPAYAFAGTSLKRFEVPSSITKIDEGAFLDCLDMTYITVPSSVTTINDATRTTRPIGFTSKGVLLSGLFMDVRPDSEGLRYAQLYSIDHDRTLDGNTLYGRFGDVSGNTWHYDVKSKTMYLNAPVFTSNNTLYYIDGTALKSDEFDVELLIVDCETSIDGYKSASPFAKINPKRISLPNSVRYISDYAFAGLTNLTSITIPDSAISISATAFKNCKNLKGINFGNGIKRITTGICRNMNSLQAVEFGSSTQSIEYAAFYNCVNLQSVHIPKSVEDIKEQAFANCYGLISIVNDSKATVRGTSFQNLPLLEEIVLNRNFVPMGDNFYGVFENYTKKKRNNLVIKFMSDDAVADVASYSFAKATKYHFGPKVTDVNFKYEYDPVKFSSITVDSENPVLYADNNCLYKKTKDSNGNEIDTLLIAQNTTGTISIKVGTDAIGENAFFANEASSVLLPSSVTSIGNNAFERCSELKTVSMPESLNTMGKAAFKDCVRLKTMNIASARTIESNAFDGCTNLSSVILPENLESIGDYAFRNCISVIGMVIPEGAKSISSNAFNGCTACDEIYIWDTAINDNDDRFTNCDNLMIHTMAGSNAYAYAREYDIPYCAYTDSDIFYDLCAMKLDVYAGYLGFCDGGHGDIQYLTVYEAGCDLDGFIIGVCEYCSEILEEIHTEATGHNYYIVADIPATETTQGTIKYTCTNCNDTYYTYTPALNPDSQPTTVTVSGTITIAINGDATSGNVPVYSASIILDGYKVATTDEDGKFSLSLQTGVHEIAIRYSYGIERTVYIVAEDKDFDCGAIPIIACDWDKNNVIDEEDVELFKLVISSKPSDPSFLRFVDLNGDNYINAKDMAIIRNCMKYDPVKYNSLVIKAS